MAVGSPHSVWTIFPSEPPHIQRPCPRCGQIRPFESRGRFRVNANGRRLDAWLIYGCLTCGATWNRPVLERVPAGRRASLVSRLEANDPSDASRFAFEVAGRDEVSQGSDFRVERSTGTEGEVELRLAVPFRVRLDRLLARELGLSRTELLTWLRNGRLRIASPGRLNRPVVSGQRVLLTTG